MNNRLFLILLTTFLIGTEVRAQYKDFNPDLNPIEQNSSYYKSSMRRVGGIIDHVVDGLEISGEEGLEYVVNKEISGTGNLVGGYVLIQSTDTDIHTCVTHAMGVSSVQAIGLSYFREFSPNYLSVNKNEIRILDDRYAKIDESMFEGQITFFNRRYEAVLVSDTKNLIFKVNDNRGDNHASLKFPAHESYPAYYKKTLISSGLNLHQFAFYYGLDNVNDFYEYVEIIQFDGDDGIDCELRSIFTITFDEGEVAAHEIDNVKDEGNSSTSANLINASSSSSSQASAKKAKAQKSSGCRSTQSPIQSLWLLLFFGVYFTCGKIMSRE